jgi:hypothetical protein
VVVEFGSSTHQDILDRYINGQDVSFSDLRKVWSDNVGFNIPYAIGYVNFFVQVRDVNRTLLPGQRIHVWLGEPPIDWSKIKTEADFLKFMPGRDTHPAEIVDQEILRKNKKALLIYGDGHFFPLPFGNYLPVLPLIEQKHPNSVYMIQMYTGFATKACTSRFEQTNRSWPASSLAAPVKGTTLRRVLFGSGCDVNPAISFRFPPSFSAAQKLKALNTTEEEFSGADADALLYLGKAASLAESPFEPSIYLDPAYLREMNRRATLGFHFNIGSAPMTDAIVQSNPMSPRYLRHY